MDRFPMKMMTAVGLVLALLAPLPALAQAIRADLLPLVPSEDCTCGTRFDPAACTFSVTVINAGLLEAGPFVVAVFYDNGLRPTQTVGGLAPGATAVVPFPAAYGCVDRSFGFGIDVDDLNQVPESNELNNETSGRCLRGCP
jgi:subtilase family serine protease